jgi:hypothetical protein
MNNAHTYVATLTTRAWRGALAGLLLFGLAGATHAAVSYDTEIPDATAPSATAVRMFEWTFASNKKYRDGFNDVDVDVIFRNGTDTWRVPAFWRGDDKWTVRFAPPAPGEFQYRLESTDRGNADLNGREGRVTIAAYAGDNALLKHGAIRISHNKRHFEHADGTPFYWLGDTWWMGLSDRIDWPGFQELTANRKAKGFTVVQACAGLAPSNEELPPLDPGFTNEGGSVWNEGFQQLNPRFFDYADRRVALLVDAQIVPVLVGAWRQALGQMGSDKLKKHWRYVIARYGAYPVLWIVGGEVYDPPASLRRTDPAGTTLYSPGWSDVARYVRSTDPYRHPVSVHEVPPPYDTALDDEALTDFDFFQPSHFGWNSIGAEVALLGTHYSRTSVTKPLVIAEIGYENLGATHLADFQRTAFWLSMLNGAAGHTYGSAPTFEGNDTTKPLQRGPRYTFLTWKEGMQYAGSYEVGIGAKLLRNYDWWKFQPHPEWVSPRGTTLLAPQSRSNEFDIDLLNLIDSATDGPRVVDELGPRGLWRERGGLFRAPYAAGIPGQVRVMYLPNFSLFSPVLPTIQKLEEDVRYRAFYWDPMTGTRFDLGAIQRPVAGAVIASERFERSSKPKWHTPVGRAAIVAGKLSTSGELLTVLSNVRETDLVASVSALSDANAGLLLRYRNPGNYLAARYSADDKTIFVVQRRDGKEERKLGQTSVANLNSPIQLTAEVRGGAAIVSVSDGTQTFTSSIVSIASNTGHPESGGVGLQHWGGATQTFDDFELRRSPELVKDAAIERRLVDAEGRVRGEMRGPDYLEGPSVLHRGWDNFGKDKTLLLDAYRPDRVPSPQDWVLVLEKEDRLITKR